jgi:heterotetrameric sarcosine oxidase beta subunit
MLWRQPSKSLRTPGNCASFQHLEHATTSISMSRYSALSLAWHALRGHQHWPRVLGASEPKRAYDMVVIGGGGHGLATAYFLAKEHGIRNIAVLERSVIGHGNSGRNTQVIRSDYFHLPSSKFFERSLRLYEGLSRELNFNVMLSQRGKINLAHGAHEMESQRRWANAILANGIDGELLTGPAEADTESQYRLALSD